MEMNLIKPRKSTKSSKNMPRGRVDKGVKADMEVIL